MREPASILRHVSKELEVSLRKLNHEGSMAHGEEMEEDLRWSGFLAKWLVREFR